MTNMTDDDRAFHQSMKPSWGPDGTLVYSGSTDAKPTKSSRRGREKNGLMAIQKGAIVSEGRDVRFAKFTNEVRSKATNLYHPTLTL
jgi:nuclear pore complex protein Nup98-Nup96